MVFNNSLNYIYIVLTILVLLMALIVFILADIEVGKAVKYISLPKEKRQMKEVFRSLMHTEKIIFIEKFVMFLNLPYFVISYFATPKPSSFMELTFISLIFLSMANGIMFVILLWIADYYKEHSIGRSNKH